MPLYEVFCLVRPSLSKPELFQILKRSCNTVLNGDGVITSIVSNGVIPLSHKIKKTHGHYHEAHALQLKFHSAPSLLNDVNHDLSTDERILRHQVKKYKDVPKVRQWRTIMQFGDSCEESKQTASAWL